MKILGIDPGKNTGFAIVEYPKRKLLKYGTFKPERIRETFNLTDAIEQLKPDIIAIEQPFSRINLRSFGRLSEIVGIVEHLYKVYMPDGKVMLTSIKKANNLMGLTGKPKPGDKTKAIQNIFGPLAIVTDDIASAIAATMVALEDIKKNND